MGRHAQEMSDSVVKYSLAEIKPHHREIARRLVLGQKASHICVSLNMSVSRMSIIINSPLFKLELRRLEEERDRDVMNVKKALDEIAPVAVEVVERTMYMAPDEELRFKAATDILDRAGFGKIVKSDINIRGRIDHSTMTEDEIRVLVRERLNRIRESDQEKEKLEIEASSIEVICEDCPTNGQKEQDGGNGDS